VALRKSQATFKVTDGLTPTDKAISGDDFTMAIQTIGTSPQIGAAYNIGPMFSYLMKTRNADLSAFEKSPEQQAYEQAVGAWQQTVEALAKQMGDAIDPKKFPPQPLPQQFGYVPGAPASQQGSAPTNQSQMSGAPQNG
jgi:hypothetical protein